MAPETQTAKITARDIHPVVAVEAGYNIYLADNCQDSELHKSAQIAVRNFNKAINSFPEKSPEALYCLNLRMAANSLARGIATRKYNLNKRIAAADQRKDDMIRRLAETEKLVGFFRGGLQLLLLGGFGYFLVRAIFGRTQTAGIDPRYASIAFALALALIGSCVKSRLIAKKVLNVFAQYNEAITQANDRYIQSVVTEYKLTAETANLAWKELTGTDPPTTPSFDDLLLGVMASGTRAPEAENHGPPLAQKPT